MARMGSMDDFVAMSLRILKVFMITYVSAILKQRYVDYIDYVDFTHLLLDLAIDVHQESFLTLLSPPCYTMFPSVNLQ